MARFLAAIREEALRVLYSAPSKQTTARAAVVLAQVAIHDYQVPVKCPEYPVMSGFYG
jgi:hypothetical protein